MVPVDNDLEAAAVEGINIVPVDSLHSLATFASRDWKPQRPRLCRFASVSFLRVVACCFETGIGLQSSAGGCQGSSEWPGLLLTSIGILAAILSPARLLLSEAEKAERKL